MATRAHLCVALLVTTTTAGLLTTGCIFGGGGGDKKAAKAPPAVPAPLAAAPQHVGQPGASVKAPASKHTDEAVARALAAKESAVQWPRPDALSLGDSPPRRVAPVAQPESVARAEPRQPRADLPPAPEAMAVREAPHGATPVAEPDPSPDAVANEPLEVSGSRVAQPAGASQDNVNDILAAKPVTPTGAAADPLAGRVAQRLRENPGDLPAHLDHQLLRFLAEEQAPDLAALSTLPAEDRELLTALIDGLTNFRTGLRADHNVLHSKKVRPLLDMAARLRSQAELWIPTIALCGRVKGYGVYEPMNAQFLAGTSHEVLVYCEVANFASQQNEQGVWEVKLSQEAILYKDDGQRVWQNRKETTVDRARNRRQDFCVAQRVNLPPNLPVDRYILKVTVTDEQVKRLAEATIPIELVAQLDPYQQEQHKPVNVGPIARPGATDEEPRTAGFSPGQTEAVGGK